MFKTISYQRHIPAVLPEPGGRLEESWVFLSWLDWSTLRCRLMLKGPPDQHPDHWVLAQQESLSQMWLLDQPDQSWGRRWGRWSQRGWWSSCVQDSWGGVRREVIQWEPGAEEEKQSRRWCHHWEERQEQGDRCCCWHYYWHHWDWGWHG